MPEKCELCGQEAGSRVEDALRERIAQLNRDVNYWMDKALRAEAQLEGVREPDVLSAGGA